MPLIISDEKLVQRLRQIAAQLEMTVEELLYHLMKQYKSPVLQQAELSPEDLAKQVRLHAYNQARQYWREHGEEGKATLTDKDLDEQFWLFDGDRVPRLKSEQEQISLLENSLHHAGKALMSAGFRSGQHDIAERSKEILRDEYADYILSKRDKSASSDDA